MGAGGDSLAAGSSRSTERQTWSSQWPSPPLSSLQDEDAHVDESTKDLTLQRRLTTGCSGKGLALCAQQHLEAGNIDGTAETPLMRGNLKLPTA